MLTSVWLESGGFLCLQELFKAGEQKFGTDEQSFVTVLGNRSAEHLRKGLCVMYMMYTCWTDSEYGSDDYEKAFTICFFNC